MMNKLGILLGAGVGYVLGARAGRERYDQMMRSVTTLRRDPRVQEAASHAQDVAADAAERAGHSAKETLHGMKDMAKEKLHSTGSGSDEDVVPPPPTPPSTPSDTLPPHPRV